MPQRAKKRRGPVKRLLRHRDGSLYDVDERCSISLEELADHLRKGGHFQCRRQDTGVDCTPQLMMDIYRANVTSMFLPANPLGRLGNLGLFFGGGDSGGLDIASSLARLISRASQDNRYQDRWDDDEWERRRPDRSLREPREFREPSEPSDDPSDEPRSRRRAIEGRTYRRRPRPGEWDPE